MTLPHFAGWCAGIAVGTAVLTAQQAAPAPGPRQEVVTDTVNAGSSKQTRNDVIGIDERGQRRLVETTESTQETLPNGRSRTVATTSAPDANGRLVMASRSTEETTIRQLAEQVRDAAGSHSPIVTVPYSEAYAAGFEDMLRRVPDVSKLERLTGFRPLTPLSEIISDVVADQRGRLPAPGRPRPASATT